MPPLLYYYQGVNTAYTNGNTGTNADRGFVVGGSTYGSFTGWVWNRENGPLCLGTNNTYRMTISSAGNVGIGTTAPAAKLHIFHLAGVYEAKAIIIGSTINGYPDDVAKIEVQRGSSYGQGWNFIVNSNGAGTPSEAMRITSEGNVGIGTTSPSYALHVYENNSDVAVYARNEHATGLCVALEGLAYGGGTNYGIYTQAYGGTTNYAGYFNGNVYGTANASFASFTDRTPLYEGDALSEIAKISGKDGEIDHSTLPAFAHVKQDVPIFEETELVEITPEDAFEIVMVEQDKIVETTDDNGKVVETKIEIGAKTESTGYQLEDGKVVEVVNEIPVYETEAVATKQLRNDVYFDERTGKVYEKPGDGQIFEKDGKIYQNNQTGIKVEEQRDIGAMVSILTVAVQQLDKANKELRERIAVLESKLK